MKYYLSILLSFVILSNAQASIIGDYFCKVHDRAKLKRIEKTKGVRIASGDFALDDLALSELQLKENYLQVYLKKNLDSKVNRHGLTPWTYKNAYGSMIKGEDIFSEIRSRAYILLDEIKSLNKIIRMFSHVI